MVKKCRLLAANTVFFHTRQFRIQWKCIVRVGYETGVETWIGVGSTMLEPLFLFNRFIYNSELLFKTILEE